MDLTFCFTIKLWMLISYWCINVPTDAQQTTTVAQQTTTVTTIQQPCIDIETDCPAIGLNSFCDAIEHKPWVMQNCRSYCGYCEAPTATQSNITTVPLPCGDIVTNCTEYGRSYLCSKYVDWAAENCSSYCGFCHVEHVVQQSLTPTGQICVDIATDCAEYDDSALCSANQHWALFNCRSHCGLCGCVDVYANCTDYAVEIPDFCSGEWAMQNCAQLCNSCPIAVKPVAQSLSSLNSGLSPSDAASALSAAGPLNTNNCVDAYTDCNAYQLGVVCNEQLHEEWAWLQCRKSCNKCLTAEAAPIVAASPTVTETTTPTVPTSSAAKPVKTTI